MARKGPILALGAVNGPFLALGVVKGSFLALGERIGPLILSGVVENVDRPAGWCPPADDVHAADQEWTNCQVTGMLPRSVPPVSCTKTGLPRSMCEASQPGHWSLTGTVTVWPL